MTPATPPPGRTLWFKLRAAASMLMLLSGLATSSVALYRVLNESDDAPRPRNVRSEPDVPPSPPAPPEPPAPNAPPAPPAPNAPPAPTPVRNEAEADGSEVLQPESVEATATLEPRTPGTSYAATNATDDAPETAWCTADDGSGEEITLTFANDALVAAVGVIPGYAKIDSRSGVDRFIGNRRVSTLTVEMDGAKAESFAFEDRRELQWAQIDASSASRSVTIHIDETHGPEDTCISEIVVRGQLPGV